VGAIPRGKRFRKVGEPGVAIEVNSSVVGWTTIPSTASGSATTQEADRSGGAADLPGHIVFRSELPAKNHDYQTSVHATVQPAEKIDLLYEIIQPRAAGQAEQRHIERAPIKP